MANINYSELSPESRRACLQGIANQQMELRNRAAIPTPTPADHQASGQVWLMKVGMETDPILVQPLHYVGHPNIIIMPLILGNLDVQRRGVVCFTPEGDMMEVNFRDVEATIVKRWLPKEGLYAIQAMFPGVRRVSPL